MNARDSSIKLTEEIEKIIQSELDKPPVEFLGYTSPIPQRVDVAVFHVNSYEEISGFATPRVGWSRAAGYSYSEKSIEEFVSRIQLNETFRDVLEQLQRKGNIEEGDETNLLYLTGYIYHITKRLLYKYPVEVDKLVDCFLKDIKEKSLWAKTRVGIIGLNVPSGGLEISPGVSIRRQNRTDYWNRVEQLNGRLIDMVSFPGSLNSSSVLEVSAKLSPSKRSNTRFLGYDFWSYTSIRQFDSIISSMHGLQAKGRGNGKREEADQRQSGA